MAVKPDQNDRVTIRIFLRIGLRMLVPGLITVFLLLQRFWQSGLSAGAVK